MKTTPKILLVGAGAMGTALLDGWNRSPVKLDVTVIDPSHPEFFGNISELSPKYSPDIIVFAVKPQLLVGVISQYVVFSKKKCIFVSNAAGVPISLYAKLLGEKETIVRVMPNLAVTVGQGMSALYSTTKLNDTEKKLVDILFTPSGKTLWVDSEEMIDAATAISGSGPAYFFRFVECLAIAGERVGLTSDQARLLARQTVVGVGEMLHQLSDEAGDLRHRVTSPGGTTAAALQVFDNQNRLGLLIEEAVVAAFKRARELGKEKHG